MSEKKPNRRKFGWIFAAVLVGFAAGCAIAAAVHSFSKEPFTIDAMETMLRHVGSGHVTALAFGITGQSAGVGAAAYRLGLGTYRCVQGAKFALKAKNFCLSRWA